MDRSENNCSSTSQTGASFLIRVQYRQNASWQGLIQWLDGKKSRHFRSFLEMAMLMQEALDYTGNEEGISNSRKWDRKEEVS